jgi:predicted nuclease with TOPRIM domain
MTTDTPLDDACPHCLTAEALSDQNTELKTEIEQLNIAGATAVEAAKLFKQRAEKAEAEVERLRDAFSHLTNEIECTPKCSSHQADHCDCGRIERAYAISASIPQNPTK